MKRIMLSILALVIGCFLLTGAAWAAEKEMPQAGFLQDYSLLNPDDPEKMVQWVYVKEGVDVSKYNKIMLDDIVFFIAQDADYKGFEASELADLGGAFHRALLMNLAGVYEFTDTPGPGVLRIRIAVTNLVPSGSVTGTVTTIVPVGLAVSAVKKAATGSHIGMGSVSIEGEILDSQTNEVLGASIDTKMGKKYKVRKGASKWGHAIDIFNGWAINIRTRLDRRAGRIEE